MLFFFFVLIYKHNYHLKWDMGYVRTIRDVILPLEPILLKILAGACIVHPFCLELYTKSAFCLRCSAHMWNQKKSRCRIIGKHVFPSLLAASRSPSAPHFKWGLEVVHVQPRVGGKLFALSDRHGLVLGARVHFRRVLAEHRRPQHRSPSFRLHLAATEKERSNEKIRKERQGRFG